MLDTLKALVPEDKDMPKRSREIEFRELFLSTKIYDVERNGVSVLKEFHVEKSESDDYIPLAKRKPSVRYGLASIIVSDTTSLLFSEGHFPALEITVNEGGKGDAEKLDDVLAAFMKEAKLQATMLEGAVKGSVGSVAFHLRILKGRVFVKPLSTAFLTPEWDEDEPDKLMKVTEKYKVTGKALKERGYDIPKKDLNRQFWFCREFARTEEAWYMPWPVYRSQQEETTGTYPVMQPDPSRSTVHNLGFVPMHWAKNLPGGDDIDGECTFEKAMPNAIFIDYQLSQGGRGLTYSSDPMLHIKEPAYSEGQFGGALIKGADRALVTSEQGDAKLLEISGSAAAAVEGYVRFVREISLELCGGNRTSPEKLSGAQSGRAMEMMNQSLIWIADKLRSSYGEGALVEILKMVLQANQVMPLKIAGMQYDRGALPAPEQLSINLKWPPWYPPTAADDANEATAVTTLKDGGVISPKTAIRKIASRFDIEDPEQELDDIEEAQQQQADREIETQKKLQPPKIVKDAA